MDQAWLNSLKKEFAIDPEHALRELRAIEYEIARSDFEPKVRNLRTSSLKRSRELREACLFCFGMSQVMGHRIWLYPVEEADFDFVAAWQIADTTHYALTQLKEVVPSELNPAAEIQPIIDKLTRYRKSHGLSVAIHLNQRTRFDPASIMVPDLEIAALWVFGSISPDQSEWMLYGNMLEQPSFSTFKYPN